MMSLPALATVWEGTKLGGFLLRTVLGARLLPTPGAAAGIARLVLP